MAKRNKYARLNKIIWITLILVFLFGYIDSVQIKGVLDTDEGWSKYEEFTAPSFIKSWILTLIVIAVIYFIFTNDLSESLYVFITPWILLKAGAQDLAFLIFSGDIGMKCMAWFGPFQNLASKYLLKETCVSTLGLILNVIGALIIVYFIGRWLKKAKW